MKTSLGGILSHKYDGFRCDESDLPVRELPGGRRRRPKAAERCLACEADRKQGRLLRPVRVILCALAYRFPLRVIPALLSCRCRVQVDDQVLPYEIPWSPSASQARQRSTVPGENQVIYGTGH
jgi:hypothetical protein